jgi:hypothetical protein
MLSKYPRYSTIDLVIFAMSSYLLRPDGQDMGYNIIILIIGWILRKYASSRSSTWQVLLTMGSWRSSSAPLPPGFGTC